MTVTSLLDQIEVAVPCEANWAEMRGDERVRFCGLCKLHVYNLAAMGRDEAETLVRETEGRLCARFYRRPDGTVVTKDCVTIAARLRRRTRRLVAAFVGLFGFASAGVAATAADAGGLGSWETWQRQPFRTIGKVVPDDWLPPQPVIMGDLCIRTPAPNAGTPVPPPAEGEIPVDPAGE